MRFRLLFVIAVLVVLSGRAIPADAQSADVVVEAEATPTEVGTEESLTYTIRVNGASLSAVETPEPPATTNLVLDQATPSTQRNLSFNSGKLDRSIAFTWTYRPMRVGIARIREARVVIRGEPYTTDEIRVRVVPQSERPAPSPTGNPATRPSAPTPRSDAESAASALSPRDLFIRATPTGDAVFQNEQVTIEYRLYFRPGIQLRHSRLASAWDANGFWREELDVASRPIPRSQEAFGRNYETITLKRVAVFPTRPGTLRVDPLRIETEAYVANRRMDERRSDRYSLQSRYEPVTLASEGLTIQSRSLPTGAPEGFNGAVGTYAMETNVTGDSARVGEAVRVTVRLRGAGNVATLQPPDFDPPAVFDAYDPEVETDVDRGGAVVRGTKTFTYVLVPTANGTFTIPPVRFAYFNPKTRRYQALSSSPTRVSVTGDPAPRAVSTTGDGLPVGDVAGLMRDATWVRTDAPPLHRQPWAYAALVAPLLLAAALIAYRRRSSADAASPADAGAPPDASDALHEAQQHLQHAHQHLRNGDVKPFYGAIERAVLGFVGARLRLPVPGMTRPRLAAHLDRHAVPDAEREALQMIMDACDQAQFTPMQPSHDSMEAALNHAQDLILRLDDVLQKA